MENYNIKEYNIQNYIEDVEEYPNPIYATSIIRNNFPYTDDYYDEEDTVEFQYLHENLSLFKTGATSTIPFDPFKTSACIVTCGGLCPGLNVVIRELWNTLKTRYGVKEIYGIQYGFKGFYKYPPKYLSEHDINLLKYNRGTFLGTSRGGFEKDKIMEKILFYDYDLVFIIGGDGTMKGASIIANEFKRLKLKKAVIHIPKTVDNDIPIIEYTFGCETAVATASKLLINYKGYLKSYPNSVGFVKIMGRECGFIATKASFLSKSVDVLLIPEEQWYIKGSKGLLEYIIKTVQVNQHCLVCVSEGAYNSCGDFSQFGDSMKDKSGNKILFDIIPTLMQELDKLASTRGMHINSSTMDPTYIVRSNEVNDFDRDYCSTLAIEAAHSAMSGFNGVSIGIIHKQYVQIPLELMSKYKVRRIDTKSKLYSNTILLNKQPKFYDEDEE